eukprot:403344984
MANGNIEKLKFETNTRIAKIFWSLIYNNIIKIESYLALLLGDFILVMAVIIDLYIENGSFKLGSLDSNIIDQILIFKESSYVIVRDIAVLSFLTLIVILLGVLMIKNSKQISLDQKLIILRVLASCFVILRTLLFTYVMLYSVRCFTDLLPDPNTELQIIVLSTTLILMTVLLLFCALFFNLMVPNKHLPWSENSNQPFLIEIFFKFLLSLTYSFKHDLRIKYITLCMVVFTLLVKYILRLTKSVMWNQKMYKITMYKNTIYLHFTFMHLFSDIFGKESNYFIFVLILLIGPILLTNYLVKHYRIQIQVDESQNFNLDAEQVHQQISQKHANFQMFSIFIMFLQHHRSNDYDFYLSEIKLQHMMKCQCYFQQVDGKMQEKCEKMKKKQRCSKNLQNQQEIKDKPRVYDSYSGTSNYQIKSSQTNLDRQFQTISNNSYHEGKIENEEFKIDKQYMNQRKAKYLESSVSVEAYQIQQKDSKGYQNHKYQKKNDFKNKNMQQFDQIFITEKSIQPNTVSEIDTNFNIKDNSNTVLQPDRQKNKKNKTNSYANKFQQDKHLGIITHFYDYHLNNINKTDYRLFLLKIFYTLMISRNFYLAHFLLIDLLNEKTAKSNIIDETIKQIHMKFFENIIQTKTQNDKQRSNKVDLKLIIESNQFMTKFDKYMIDVSNKISEFWQTLYSQKEQSNLYQMGLIISRKLERVKQVYKDVEQKLTQNVDSKLYVKMAAFYKLVLFKSKECQDEMIKYRNNCTTQKMFKSNRSYDKVQEKGIIIGKFHPTQPMRIKFINQIAQKLTLYDLSQVQNLKVNNLMPELIAENHHLFIQKFLKTGKSRAINNQIMVQIKQRDGYIILANISIFINNGNYQHLTMFLEKVIDFNPFSDDQSNELLRQPYGYMTVDRNLRIHEISRSCKCVCNLSQRVLEKIRDQSSNFIYLDDIFNIQDSNENIKQELFSGRIFSQAFARYNDRLDNYEEGIKSVMSEREYNSLQISSMISVDGDYSITCIVQKYLEGGLVLPLIFIKQNRSTSMFQQFKSTLINDEIIGIESQAKDNFMSAYLKNDQIESVSLGEMDFNSQSSHSSGSQSDSMMQAFSKFSQQIDQQTTPITLKFVLNIFTIMIVIIFATSMVEFILSFQNFDQSNFGIRVTNLALGRFSSFRQIRPAIVTMILIANGVQPNTNQVFSNRFNVYMRALEKYSEEFRGQQVELESLQLLRTEYMLQMQYLDQRNKYFNKSQTPSQSVYLYLDEVHDVAMQAQSKGPSLFISQNVNIYNKTSFLQLQSASRIEQQLYMILQNQNHNLFNDARKFTRTYNGLQADIAAKVTYTKTMTYICIALICLSSLLATPIILKIIRRIKALLGLFLDFSLPEIEQNILNVIDFQDYMSQDSGFTLNQNKQKAIKNFNSLGKANQNVLGTGQLDINNVNGSRNLKSVSSRKQTSQKIKRKDRDQSQYKKTKNTFDGAIELDDESRQNKYQINERKTNNYQDPPSSSYSEDDQEKISNHNKNIHSQKQDANLQKSHHKSETPLRLQIRNQLRQKMIKYLLFVGIYAIVMSAYFITFYFLSENAFNKMTQNIDILIAVKSRKTSKDNAIFSIIETYRLNRTILINGGSELMAYYIKRGQEEEVDYQTRIIKGKPTQLSPIQKMIDDYETAKFCDTAFSQLTDIQDTNLLVSADTCKTMGNGELSQGLTIFFYQILQNLQQISLGFTKSLRTEERIKEVIGTQKFTEIHDSLLKPVSDPWTKLEAQVLQQLYDFNFAQKRNFIILFCAFICILVIVCVIFYSSKIYYINFILKKQECTD